VTETEPRVLRFEEPCGQFQDLAVPDSLDCLVAAAVGVVAATEDGGDRTRLLERLSAGDDAAVLLASDVVKRALSLER
jgi:hypothetical protein